MCLVEVFVYVVESEFCFLQMYIERAISHSVKLSQTVLIVALKALNTVDVVRSESKFIVAMIDSEKLVEALIDEPS